MTHQPCTTHCGLSGDRCECLKAFMAKQAGTDLAAPSPDVLALVEALRLAHKRLVWAAGLIENDTARDMAATHAEEARAALASITDTGGKSDG